MILEAPVSEAFIQKCRLGFRTRRSVGIVACIADLACGPLLERIAGRFEFYRATEATRNENRRREQKQKTNESTHSTQHAHRAYVKGITHTRLSRHCHRSLEAAVSERRPLRGMSDRERAPKERSLPSATHPEPGQRSGPDAAPVAKNALRHRQKRDSFSAPRLRRTSDPGHASGLDAASAARNEQDSASANNLTEERHLLGADDFGRNSAMDCHFDASFRRTDCGLSLGSRNPCLWNPDSDSPWKREIRTFESAWKLQVGNWAGIYTQRGEGEGKYLFTKLPFLRKTPRTKWDPVRFIRGSVFRVTYSGLFGRQSAYGRDLIAVWCRHRRALCQFSIRFRRNYKIPPTV
ncbi:hypothetical protein ACLOJK_020029 [Asimina triloba]